jgi:hypothetical protein
MAGRPKLDDPTLPPIRPAADEANRGHAAGLAILGSALLRSDLPIWIGWMLIGSMMLLFVLTLIFHDMVPLMFYLVTLISGIALVELVNRTVYASVGD